MASLVHSFHAIADARSPRLGVIVKRSYRFAPSRRAEPTNEEPALARKANDLDALQKPRTDVLLDARAHAVAGPVAELVTGVLVGAARKVVRVRGERRIQRAANGRLRATAAEPFSEMPLDWTRAYGGSDRYAEKLLQRDRKWGACSYPRNPVGRGFFLAVDLERLDGCALPNLDDPDDPVEPDRLVAEDALDWVDRPTAAGFGAIDLFTFPRCMFHPLRPDWRPPRRPLRELALGALDPSDLADRPLDAAASPEAFSAAAPGLGVCRLQGNERVTLWHLHPQHELLEFDLPARKPRLLLEPPRTRVYELEPKLATVLIEPDEDRVTLTWAGSMPVAAVYPEEMCKEMRHGVLWS